MVGPVLRPITCKEFDSIIEVFKVKSFLDGKYTSEMKDHVLPIVKNLSLNLLIVKSDFQASRTIIVYYRCMLLANIKKIFLSDN